MTGMVDPHHESTVAAVTLATTSLDTISAIRHAVMLMQRHVAEGYASLDAQEMRTALGQPHEHDVCDSCFAATRKGLDAAKPTVERVTESYNERAGAVDESVRWMARRAVELRSGLFPLAEWPLWIQHQQKVVAASKTILTLSEDLEVAMAHCSGASAAVPKCSECGPKMRADAAAMAMEEGAISEN